MKLFTTALFCCAFSFCLQAQEKATLTKEETVNYISKKMTEVVKSGSFMNDKKQSWYCWKQTIDLNSNGITIFHSVNNDKDEEFGKFKAARWGADKPNLTNGRIYNCDYSKYKTTIDLNPSYITSIELSSNNNANTSVGRIVVKLRSKIAKVSSIHSYTYSERQDGCEYMDSSEPNNFISAEFEIYFLQADAENFNKLKKALEHLRDLFKAEDDPFGN